MRSCFPPRRGWSEQEVFGGWWWRRLRLRLGSRSSQIDQLRLAMAMQKLARPAPEATASPQDVTSEVSANVVMTR